MSLEQLPVLMIDTQTTGMRPSNGQLLELAWTVAAAADEGQIQSHLLRLPEGESIPYRVTELTGITDDDLKEGKEFGEVLEALQKSLVQLPEPRLAVIHYAQFEKPFLADLYARAGIETLPFEILCSHSLTKRLFPDLPSQNIRGTAGFFGGSPGQLKRSAAHVRATAEIWRGLVNKLRENGIHELPSLREWMKNKSKPAKGRYQYRMEAEKRLALPDRPGVYRMLAKSGEVLYVGKATSLKSRVNSYFRGKAGRDRRKLELMAQVWDLKVTECQTALEAALLEADEIKKFNPPYNVVMKKGRRQLLFYSRDFASVSHVHDEQHPYGPFRNNNSIGHLILLAKSVRTGEFEQVFFDFVPPEQLQKGFDLFCRDIGFAASRGENFRVLLALGVNLFRLDQRMAENEAETCADEEQIEDESPLDEAGRRIYSDEEIREKFGRLFCRAGYEFIRAKRLGRLLNSRITYEHAGLSRQLSFSNGRQMDGATQEQPPSPWHELGIETYDRMSVLLSELEKYEHRIEWTRGKS